MVLMVQAKQHSLMKSANKQGQSICILLTGGKTRSLTTTLQQSGGQQDKHDQLLLTDGGHQKQSMPKLFEAAVHGPYKDVCAKE